MLSILRDIVINFKFRFNYQIFFLWIIVMHTVICYKREAFCDLWRQQVGRFENKNCDDHVVSHWVLIFWQEKWYAKYFFFYKNIFIINTSIIIRKFQGCNKNTHCIKTIIILEFEGNLNDIYIIKYTAYSFLSCGKYIQNGYKITSF